MSDLTIETLNTKGYQNWIKGGLGLLTVKYVLCRYTEYIVKEQYDKVLAKLKETDDKYKLLKNAVKCNQLFQQSTWVNSNLQAHQLPPEQRFNYIEYGKCFIRPSGYCSKKSISDIDYPGLIHILVNNTGLHAYLEHPPIKTKDKIEESHVFAKGLNVRNDILHSPDESLGTKALNGYLVDMIAVLDNLKPLLEESGAGEERISNAKENLCQLQKEDFHISTSDEWKVVQEAIKAHTSAIEYLKEEHMLTLESVDNLYQKHHDLEQSHRDVEQRVRKLERNLEMQDQLTISMEVHTTQQSYIKQKQDLQNYLFTLYKKFYIKTSCCPLKPRDNNITISDIYVKPAMIVEEPRRCSRRHIEPVELARNGHDTKKIFVIGNVGTGKTSLCQIMLHSWCYAVENSRTLEAFLGCNTNDDIQFADIIKEIKEFDFVFFLPLRVVEEWIVAMEAMIKSYLCEFGNVSIIDDIFKNESEKCLILADGLDEWRSPPFNERLPLHQTYGIPTLNIMTKAKCILTSRPTSTGILNMRCSDYDLKVGLLGVYSMKTIIERYVDRYNIGESIITDAFLEKVKTRRLEHMEQTPMFLLQIFWQYVHEGTFGHTMSDIYSSIINIMFQWLQTRSEATNMLSDTGATENMHLPDALEKYEILAENRMLIFNLSRIAFEIYERYRESAPISRHELEKYCDHVTSVLKTGILYEEKCYSPSHTTQLSFVHPSFFEYFVALYSVIGYQSKKTEILDKLFGTCGTIADVLGLSSVIVMVCGLAPQLIVHISKHIYNIVERKSGTNSQDGEPLQIQHLIIKCLSDTAASGMVESKNIPLHALVVAADQDFSTTAELIEHIDTDKVLNLVINACRFSGIYEDMTDGLYFLTIDTFQRQAVVQQNCLLKFYVRANCLNSFTICDCSISHDNCSTLMSFLTQAVLLEFLQVKNVRCETKLQDHQDHHVIDLSNNDKIESLSFENKQSTSISRLSNANLHKCVALSTGLTDIDCLLNANKLKHLDYGSPDERHVEYKRQMNTVVQTLHQLQTMHVRNMICSEICPNVCSSMLNLKYIRFSFVRMSPKTWREFLDSLRSLQCSVKVETHCLFLTEEDRDEALSSVLNSKDNYKVNDLKKKGKQFHLHFELKNV